MLVSNQGLSPRVLRHVGEWKGLGTTVFCYRAVLHRTSQASFNTCSLYQKPCENQYGAVSNIEARQHGLYELSAPSNDSSGKNSSNASDYDEPILRLPRSVQATYLRPLKRQAKYGVPSCDLQLRSYSVRNVEFLADFAMRAAYYLKLPASGPIPLPRIVERWTVAKSNFVHKKNQENFERITLRRLIQIQDGHPDTVKLWLAFVRKHSYYGVGMKANIWEYDKLGVGKHMDVNLESVKNTVNPTWAHFGRKKNTSTSEKVMEMMKYGEFEHLQ